MFTFSETQTDCRIRTDIDWDGAAEPGYDITEPSLFQIYHNYLIKTPLSIVLYILFEFEYYKDMCIIIDI